MLEQSGGAITARGLGLLLELAQGFLEGIAALVGELEVFVAVVEIHRDEEFERESQLFYRLGAFGFVLGLEFELFGLIEHLVDERLWCLEATSEILERSKTPFQSFAIVVHITERSRVEEVVATNGGKKLRSRRGVERHKDIGHHTSSPVDGTSLDERAIDHRRIEAYGVLVKEFAVVETLFEVERIFLLLALLVGLLDATPRGCSSAM